MQPRYSCSKSPKLDCVQYWTIFEGEEANVEFRRYGAKQQSFVNQQRGMHDSTGHCPHHGRCTASRPHLRRNALWDCRPASDRTNDGARRISSPRGSQQFLLTLSKHTHIFLTMSMLVSIKEAAEILSVSTTLRQWESDLGLRCS